MVFDLVSVCSAGAVVCFTSEKICLDLDRTRHRRLSLSLSSRAPWDIYERIDIIILLI